MEEAEKNTPEITLDSKSKVFFVVLGLLIAGSVAVTCYKYMVKRDYIIQAATDCDPESETCFVWECDPESLVEGEACTGVPDNDIWYYKNIERKANQMPLCDPNDENCDALACEENNPDCQEILCNEENVPEGETCNNPEQYKIDNPPEEDSEECAPDDEECLLAQEECAPDDQECLDAQDSECTSDDPADCEEAPADESGSDTSGDSVDENNSSGDGSDAGESSSDINIPPPGVQPM
jgi:hypothetical protein